MLAMQENDGISTRSEELLSGGGAAGAGGKVVEEAHAVHAEESRHECMRSLRQERPTSLHVVLKRHSRSAALCKVQV